MTLDVTDFVCLDFAGVNIEFAAVTFDDDIEAVEFNQLISACSSVDNETKVFQPFTVQLITLIPIITDQLGYKDVDDDIWIGE